MLVLNVLEPCLELGSTAILRLCASNILIWNPTIGHSHVKFLSNVADVLTADGHNVTIFSPTMDPQVTHFANRLPARTIRFSANGSDDLFTKMDMKLPSLWDSPACNGGICFKFSDTDLMNEQNLNYCKDLLEDVEMMNTLNESKFDLTYTEGFDYCAPGMFQDLDNVLNEKDATVLFSLGSIAQSKDMPPWLKNDIVDTFASFPNVTFIWKYEGDDTTLLESHPNIHQMKWVPQADLLADKRLSLFITHGGMNSMLEAMFHGKPMIVIPLFGDQPLNSKNVIRLGTGALIERNNLNRETLTEAIQKTLGNKKITREAAFVASLLARRPQQYRDDIAKWAKIIIEHGKIDYLLLHSRNMNLIQYYSLDILALIASITIILVFLLLWLLKRVLSNLRVVKLKQA